MGMFLEGVTLCRAWVGDRQPRRSTPSVEHKVEPLVAVLVLVFLRLIPTDANPGAAFSLVPYSLNLDHLHGKDCQ